MNRRGGFLYLRTTVSQGPLREVVVVVREADWRVVGQAWVFFGLGQLQVERLEADVFSSRWNGGAPDAGAARP